MAILLAAVLALPGKPGHALLELEKDVDRAEAILASGHGSLERAARLETGFRRSQIGATTRRRRQSLRTS